LLVQIKKNADQKVHAKAKRRRLEVTNWSYCERIEC